MFLCHNTHHLHVIILNLIVDTELFLNESLTMTQSMDQFENKTKSFVILYVKFWKKKLSNRSISSLDYLNSTLKVLNLLLKKLVKSITAASHWEDSRIFCFISSLRSNLKCFWQLFCSQETVSCKTTGFRTAKYLINSHVKGLLSKIFFNVLTRNSVPPSYIFFVSLMVISCLLSLLNKQWMPKPSSTLFLGNRFPFSPKLISASSFAVLHFSNTYIHIYEWDHWLFTLILLQVWFNNGACKTKGYFNLSKQINNSITDLRLAFICQLFVLWKAFPKFHYLFYILPDFYHPVCKTHCFQPIEGYKSIMGTHSISLPLEKLSY